MVKSEKIFEEQQAIAFGESIKDTEIEYCREVICRFLNTIGIQTQDKHPDTNEPLEFSFDDAYSMLIKEGYLLETRVESINKKAIFSARIFAEAYREQIEVRSTYSVSLHAVTPEDLIERETEKAE